MSKPLPTPSTFDSLQKAIVERFPSLSKRLQQIATYALDNPSDLALETIATVAERANVQPSSLIRFAKELGFSGYSEMQRVFRLRLTDAMPDYNERLRTLIAAYKTLGGSFTGDLAVDPTHLRDLQPAPGSARATSSWAPFFSSRSRISEAISDLIGMKESPSAPAR